MTVNTAAVSAKLALPAGKTKSKAKKTIFSNTKALVKIGIGIFVFMALVGGGFAYQRAYAEKVYPKVMVAGVDIGGMTYDEAKNALENKIAELNEQGPTIVHNGATYNPKLDELGVAFNVDEIINQAYKYGRDKSITAKITETYKLLISGKQITINPKIDENKLNDYLSGLAKVIEKEPVNASLSIKNGEITLSSAEKGRGLDKEKLKEDVTDFINSGQNGQIVMETSDLEPRITEDGTASARAQAENYMNSAPITITFENSIWTADRAEIGSWIKFSESSDKLIASTDPSGFIKSIENQVEIKAVDREVEDGTGNVLSEGSDGRGVDSNTLSAQIKDALNAQKANSSFALVTFAAPRGQKTIFPHAQPGRYIGRYIDINLSEQTLYVFEGSTLVNQFLISSGKSGYATPTGEYAVWGKTRSQLMDGPDYYLPNVPWISWFNGEIAIHGTYWHSNFGTPMSHGCINASIDNAEMVYNFVEVGTPVYVHY